MTTKEQTLADLAVEVIRLRRELDELRSSLAAEIVTKAIVVTGQFGETTKLHGGEIEMLYPAGLGDSGSFVLLTVRGESADVQTGVELVTTHGHLAAKYTAEMCATNESVEAYATFEARAPGSDVALSTLATVTA